MNLAVCYLPTLNVFIERQIADNKRKYFIGHVHASLSSEGKEIKQVEIN